MTIAETIDNVRASFEMEDMIMTPEDKQRGIDILQGNITIEQAINDIILKYTNKAKSV